MPKKSSKISKHSRSEQLGPDFFRRPALVVARDLIGKVLVRRMGDEEIAGVIVETEAYDGFQDRASHAHRGETKRNAPMFKQGGLWYVYFVYGMHWMLNAVTGDARYPAAILFRGVAGVRGPARLTKAFGIDRRQDGQAISEETGLWIEDRGIRMPRAFIKRGPRIGVAYAGDWALEPYRFYVDDKKFLGTYAHLPLQTPAARGRSRSPGRRRV